MASTMCSKIIALATVVTYIVYIVGFACPNWLQKDFTLKVPGASLGLPSPLDTMDITINVQSNMGLLKSCDQQEILIPGNTANKENCGSDGAKDWQKAAAGVAITAVCFGLSSLILSILAVVVPKLQGCKKTRGAIIAHNFLIVILILVSLILYAVNKKIQVSPPLPLEIEFNLDWAYYLTIVPAILYTGLVLLNIFELVWYPSKASVAITKQVEGVVAYSK